MGVMRLDFWNFAEDLTEEKGVGLVEKGVGLLDDLHGGVSGSHLETNEMLEKVQRSFFWVNLGADVEAWCQRNDVCALSRSKEEIQG